MSLCRKAGRIDTNNENAFSAHNALMRYAYTNGDYIVRATRQH